MELLGGKVKGACGGDHIGQHPHRHGVVGVCQSLTHGHLAAVHAVHVDRPGLAVHNLIGVIGHHGNGADKSHLNGGGVDGQGLDGRTGLALGIGGQVIAAVDGLFSQPSGQGHNVPRLVVDDGNGGLQLLARLFGGVVQGVGVLIDGLHLGLDLRVHTGVDLQAAAGEHLADILVGVAGLLLQIVHHVGDDLLLVPGVDVGIGLAVAGIGAHKDQLLGHGFVILRLGDLLLLEHLAQDDLLAVLVPLLAVPQLALGVFHPGGGVGAVLGGVVGDGNKAGALGQGQIGGGLAEILFGGRSHALTAAAQGDDVEVELQNDILIILGVHIQRPEDLGDLTLDGGLVVIGQVFDELLGDGGAALDVSAGEHAEHRLGGAPPVHAVVGPEPPVLNGHGGVFQILGHVLVVHPLRAGDAEHLAKLLVLSGVLVLIVHDAVFVQGEAVQVHVGVGQDHIDDIHRSEAAHDGAGGHKDEQQGADGSQSTAAPLFLGRSAPGRAAGTGAGAAAGMGSGPGTGLPVPGGTGRIILFRHLSYLRLVRGFALMVHGLGFARPRWGAAAILLS